jgi:hypothetical protein
LKKCFCIPPEQNAAFVANMEDVLDVYHREYDEDCPVVCMDEKPFQLTDERHKPISMEPGDVKRYDYEYIRNGTCSIFMFAEPLKGQRYVSVREQRTKKDWAEEVAHILEVIYPQAPKICLVMDNLNTHNISSLYEAFPPQRARALARRLEIHYTPKHGSWLNIAESELSAMTIQCLERRFSDIDILRQELSAWSASRNAASVAIKWQFRTADARVKLRRLYPII